MVEVEFDVNHAVRECILVAYETGRKFESLPPTSVSVPMIVHDNYWKEKDPLITKDNIVECLACIPTIGEKIHLAYKAGREDEWINQQALNDSYSKPVEEEKTAYGEYFLELYKDVKNRENLVKYDHAGDLAKMFAFRSQYESCIADIDEIAIDMTPDNFEQHCDVQKSLEAIINYVNDLLLDKLGDKLGEQGCEDHIVVHFYKKMSKKNNDELFNEDYIKLLFALNS